jgi:hypothetical protein
MLAREGYVLRSLVRGLPFGIRLAGKRKSYLGTNFFTAQSEKEVGMPGISI